MPFSRIMSRAKLFELLSDSLYIEPRDQLEEVFRQTIDDLWANPSGCRLTHEAAQRVFALLGDPRRSALVMREGGHALALADWRALLDFADACWAAAPASRALR